MTIHNIEVDGPMPEGYIITKIHIHFCTLNTDGSMTILGHAEIKPCGDIKGDVSI